VSQRDPATGNLVTTNIPYYLPDAPAEVINYGKNLTAWSFGALYKPAQNTSLFVRASRGTRFNADRMTFNGYFTASGGLNATTGAAAVSDIVNQYELGLKNGGNIAGGRYTAELTVYKSNFNITTYELSQTKCGGVSTGCIVANRYKTTGAEFYGTYRNGGFSLLANLTYNKAKKQPAGTVAYVRSDGIPDLSYTVAVNYDISDMGSIGGTVTGVTSTVDNDGLEYPGAALFGVNAKITPIKNLELGINVSNLFNTLTAMGPAGIASRTGNSVILNMTSALGRTVSSTARFSF
jgi:outer membrane receptor protein involved in Fe transport